ncbi:hypothetical protein RND71_010554 [Anisodus tanguticus]|uniref:K-box domain-containing protein n=1 Tax=Anisodus tanguticus TaxID=243964 RepID=A0AAE1VS90_9SOLA|nr:hypothetical protein RND71_010554 [Anisodus tanguticus]
MPLNQSITVIKTAFFSSMSETLERYHRCSYGELKAGQSSKDSQYSYQEYMKLKAKVEVLQESQRHILGEDLGQLNITNLEQLERQLDSSVRQIRSRREQSLLEINRSLKLKLEENSVAHQAHWHTGEQNIQFRHQSVQSEEFFQPLQCNNAVQNRYNQAPSDNIESSTQYATGILPGWMFDGGS